MVYEEKNIFLKIKEIIYKERKIVEELGEIQKNLDSVKDSNERKMALSQISRIKEYFKKIDSELRENLEKIKIRISLPRTGVLLNEARYTPQMQNDSIKNKNTQRRSLIKKRKDLANDALRRITLKRLKKKGRRVKEISEKKPSKYIQTANRFFSNFSVRMLEKGNFRKLKRDLIKTNIQMLAKSYLSVMFFTTLISIFIGIFLFAFFLFFNITPLLPIITPMKTELSKRFLQVFWIIPVAPLLTFISMYIYPNLERRSLEGKINQEIPFAAIHMSSISGSMINPSKIFSVIISTHEYPNIEREFIKILNEVNVLGYDLVTALRNIAFNSPSKKLSELLNGIAITITSGGDLPNFFEKRAQSLLFDYRLEREKTTKSAETFMDIYISTVIAAPMILMLLLIIMKISGLGVDLSTSMISLIMVSGVSLANFFFLLFLHLKHQST